MKADLHSHSTASDGVHTPTETVKMAKEAGLRAFAITDHDTVGGVEEGLRTGREIGIEVIPGIEMSSLANGQDIHVLGYYVNHTDPTFLQKLKELRETRGSRNRMMVEKLRELGIDITIEEVKARKEGMDNQNVGRPHIAEVLIAKGVVQSMNEAFDKYLGKDGQAYCNPERIPPEKAIDLIIEAGGVPVLAHPGLYEDDALVERIIQQGLIGIEVYHPDHDELAELRYLKLAEKYQLLVTAGSDFHGSRNGSMYHAPIGTSTIDPSVIDKLKDKAKNR